MNCRICGGVCNFLGCVPFDRNHTNIGIVDNTPIEYYKCSNCYYIFCPDMQTWTPDYIASKVYNREYIKYDPDYAGARPTNYANMLLNNIHYSRYPNIKHLDYGSGEGLLSKILTSKKWNSTNYDPYSMPSKPVGLFNFITAIEVAEHAASIEILIKDIKQYLTKDGVILISTLLSEESTKISWDYILPRCGHISMVSEKTMKIVAKNNGLFFKTISINLHTLQPYRSNAKNVLGWLNG